MIIFLLAGIPVAGAIAVALFIKTLQQAK